VKLTVIGMISGTSYDAVDAAAATFELVGDELRCTPLGLHSQDIPDPVRGRIARLLPPNLITIEDVCRLDTELAQFFGDVGAAANAGLTGGTADLLVSHGQTVFHWVADGHALGTLQLGNPAWIAERTGLTTVTDLRTRDITHGGHGAPLASTLDDLLVLPGETRRGALNLGGIANITVRDRGRVIAYDLGPASALLDAVVADATDGHERMDFNGARAAAGTVEQDLLQHLLDDAYYRLPPPKSTGKELFHLDYVRLATANRSMHTDDLLATLTELTAAVIAQACQQYRIEELVVAGGGVRNPTLMARIAQLSAPTEIRLIDEFGLPAQGKEAYLCALLGYLSVHGLPGTIPSATGAQEAPILGSITPGRQPLRLPDPASTAPRKMRIYPGATVEP